MSLSDVVDQFILDVDRQTRLRLEVLQEEAQSQLVDPFKLTSDSMQRANNFNIHLPARMQFRIQNAQDSQVLAGLVPLNDFQTISEKSSEAIRRIYTSTGLSVQQASFTTEEPISDLHRNALLKVRMPGQE